MHFAGELFKLMTRTEMVHVPYRGSAPALNDLLAGNVDLIFDNITTVWPQVQQGNLRAFGVAGLRALAAGAGGADDRRDRARLRGAVLGRRRCAGKTPPAVVREDSRPVRRGVRHRSSSIGSPSSAPPPTANTPAEFTQLS